MSPSIDCPPDTKVEVVTDLLHGVSVADPYRWLEQQTSPQTRDWIDAQTRYARGYLDRVPGKDRIRSRVSKWFQREDCDSFLRNGNLLIFRKRIAGRQQACICMRGSADGLDQVLLDPLERGLDSYAAVSPLRISPDGQLLLYELKEGGERAGTFQLLDISTGNQLKDFLPRGYLRGFVFSENSRAFYYSHEPIETGKRSARRSVYKHILGTDSGWDREIFHAGIGDWLRLVLLSGPRTLGFLVYRFLEKRYTDFYICPIGETLPVVEILRNADYTFVPKMVAGRIFALTNCQAPNRRIVEVQHRTGTAPLFLDLVPETDVPVVSWSVTAQHLVVTYRGPTRTRLAIFDHFGRPVNEVCSSEEETLRVVASHPADDDLLLERESFTRPAEVTWWNGKENPWRSSSGGSFGRASDGFRTLHLSYPSIDGTEIPMYLVGRDDVLTGTDNPTVMTAYGGYGLAVSPQFSVLVRFLLECGCLFCLPGIRGGSELGVRWHHAGRHRNRQTAFDDFLSAALWLRQTARTSRLAIFGASNAGLLMGAALTQRPDLFCAAVCMVPLFDMLRYHLFDRAFVWKEEFGTPEDSQDLDILLRYSPYHNVREGVAYPAVMIVSGDADQNCNAMHARKMTARLQAASVSGRPILLDYNPKRGHSPVLPLSDRIEALTDRLAFLCDQLQLLI
jgi:prolyl oligopeptidase